MLAEKKLERIRRLVESKAMSEDDLDVGLSDVEVLAAYLKELDSAGTLRIPAPDWAASKLPGLVMPPLPMMCAGFAPLEIPPLEEVGKTIRLFLRGMDAMHGE